jgi:hypothetical protein
MKIVIVIVLVIVILSIALGAYFMMKPSAEQSQEAVDSLANAAASSEAMPESEAKEAAEVAKANIPADNTEAKAAIDQLEAAATTPAAAPVPAVAAVANIASAGIAAPPVISTPFASAGIAAPPVISTPFASAGIQNPCSGYTDDSKGVSKECYNQIWKEAGCGGNPFDIPDKENWNKDKTLAALRNDAKVWYDYANNRGSGYHKGFCKSLSNPSSYIRYVRSNRNYLH